MITQITITVRRSDLLPRGKAYLGPTGIAFKGGAIAWAEISKFGAEETEVIANPLSGLSGAALFGYTASIFAGPIGIAAAAIIGAGITGMSYLENFEIWSHSGLSADVRGKNGTMKQAREWRDLCEHILASATPEPAVLPEKRRVPFYSKKRSE